MTVRRDVLGAYKLRWKRRRFLFRALRKRRQLSQIVDRTDGISKDAVLCFSTVRNEALRLPYFLNHHRNLGVDQFIFVDNASDDGTAEYLLDQPDVSLWHTDASYRLSRFGVDWLTYLQLKFGHGHWCLTLDADELFVYPKMDTHNLSDLGRQLDDTGVQSMGAMMLDLYPRGPVNDQDYQAGQNPIDVLDHFDPYGYFVQRQKPMENLWLQGGPRARMFFAGNLRRAPTLNKIPFVKWNRRFAYVNSTHSALPKRLNHVYDTATTRATTGVLLHTKFLPIIGAKSAEEKHRGEHFGQPEDFDSYYDRLIENPTLLYDGSVKYQGWAQLEQLGLMSRGDWH